MSSVSVCMNRAPISSIHLLAGRPTRMPRCLAQNSHEICIRQGMRRGHVHDALDLLVVNQPQRRPNKILVVDPFRRALREPQRDPARVAVRRRSGPRRGRPTSASRPSPSPEHPGTLGGLAGRRAWPSHQPAVDRALGDRRSTRVPRQTVRASTSSMQPQNACACGPPRRRMKSENTQNSVKIRRRNSGILTGSSAKQGDGEPCRRIGASPGCPFGFEG